MNKSLLYILIMLSLFFVSCKSKKGLIKTDVPQSIEYTSSLKADSIIKKINNSNFDFTWLSAKIKTKYKKASGEGQSFKTYVKIKKDSAIWATVLFVQIPVLTVVLTPDSVKLLNRKDKKYALTDYNYLNQMLNTSVTYYNIQNLLVGNPIEIDTASSNYLVELNNDIYLSNVPASKINNIDDKWVYKYWINELIKPGKTILSNPLKKSNLLIEQKDYTTENNLPFPNHTEATFTSEKDTINIKLNYNKIKLNEPLKMGFTIPDNYTTY